MFNFGFVVEQALGHVTHYQNLRRWVDEDADICPTWMPIRWTVNDIWKYMPVISNNWSLQASLRTRDALNATRRIQSLDVLFLHTQTLALFAIPFMRQIPTIISTDGTPLNFDTMGTPYNHKVGANSLLERRKFLWNKSTYHSATAVVAFCQWAKDSLVDDYDVPAEKVTVIPPGVDLEKWNFRRDKTEHQISTNALRLLFVGGDFARKGGYTLLEAFRNSLNQDCIAELERRLGLDSQTSSKPPSSDGLKKKDKIRTKSLREKGKRPSGGQILEVITEALQGNVSVFISSNTTT